jgi:hypothetical protein
MIGRAGECRGQLGFYDVDKRLISAKGDPLEALKQHRSFRELPR